MKSSIKLFSIGIFFFVFHFSSVLANDDVIVVYLVDENDTVSLEKLETEGQELRPIESLDDLIANLQDLPPLNKRQQRIADRIKAEQREFIRTLDDFLASPFDPQDDEAIAEFNELRERIVYSVFSSPTHSIFYARLYLINHLWLENQTEVERFNSLDRHLMDRSIEIDEQRRKVERIAGAIGATLGLVAGGTIGYKIGARYMAIKPDTKTLALLTKLAGRASIVIVGVYGGMEIGKQVGQYIGYLGSNLLYGNLRDYIRPIDGTEDLRDLLDAL